MTTKTAELGTKPAAFKGLLRYRKDERGSLTIFGLFIFLAILTICGVAVDMMNYEKERVAVQNTLDTAIVAATRLNQEADTDAEVRALVKDYFVKAGYDPDIVTVNPNIEVPAGGDEETLRTVSAVVDFDLDTMFLNMVGVESLPGAVGGGAREGQQLIEIALVLDISGSMGWNNKLQNMKDAAKEFVSFVLEKNGQERVMISIIPYNMQVHMSEDLLARIDWDNPLNELVPPPAHPGAVAQYFPADSAARCARFLDADFDSRRLAAATQGLERSAKFARGNFNYEHPGEGEASPADSNRFWCGSGYPEMLLYQNDEAKLHAHIDSLTARGMTAIDYGMKWATGVLDPSFRPKVQAMLADTQALKAAAQTASAASGDPYVPPSEAWLVPESVAGHPVDYGTPNVFKYVVIMTDGANTQHLDLKEEFKYGPTRIWWSQDLARTPDISVPTDPDDPVVEFDGFLVEMPQNTEAERWYRPGSPFTTDDDDFLSEAEFQAFADAKQWTYHQIYNRFSVRNAADYFFREDGPARTAHRNAEVDTGGYATADVNLRRICDKAQEGGRMDVFAVAFEAPAGGVAAMQNCVQNKTGRFFDVAGTQISDAFKVIATEITKLRLTQ